MSQGARAVTAFALAAPQRISCLILDGPLDYGRTQAANILAEQSPGAERATIPAAGHLSNLDNPQAYNAVVRTFLERHAIPFR